MVISIFVSKLNYLVSPLNSQKKKTKFPGKGPIMKPVRPTLHPPRQGYRLIPAGGG